MLSSLASRLAGPFLIPAALLLAAAIVASMAVRTTRAMVADARAQALAERDAHWTAEIEKANAEAARRIAEQAKAALAVEIAANAKVQAAQDRLAELERENAALPDGDARGIGRDRVRLLNR